MSTGNELSKEPELDLASESKRGGPAEVLTLAWPLMLSTGLFSLTLFVDRTLLYWLSDEAASAAMSGGTAFWVLICVPTGMIGYTSTFVSQYFGAKRIDRAMQVVIQGLWLSLAMGPIFLLVAIYIEDLFLYFQHPPELIAMEVEYFRWIAPGAWAMVFASAITGLFAGIGRTRVLLLCDVVSTLVNVIGDFILIFGLMGFPKLGVQGAAIASSIAIIAKLVMMSWIAMRFWREQQTFAEANESNRMQMTTDRSNEKDPSRTQKQMIPNSSFHPEFDWALMKRLIVYGWPAGVQMLAESVSFSIIMLFVGQLGSLEMAATTLALGVNLIAFVPINGLGMAISVLVGQNLAAGRLDVAKRCVRSGLGIAFVYASFFAILYGFFPEASLWIYAAGTDPERFQEMQPLLRPLLWIIAGYCIFDAFQIVFMSTIKGAGDTQFVFLASIVIGVSVVGSGKLLGDRFGGGLYWWWGVIFVWILAMLIVFGARYFQGKWQTMRVIEPQFQEEPSKPS